MSKNSGTAGKSDPAQESAAEWVALASLKPWDKNPRKNDAAVKSVVASIKRFGFGAPILARRADGEIIAGHTRAKAAEVLKLDRVPVRYLDLDPADAHLLAVADNKLGELAEWDASSLASILSEYGLDDAALAGFDKAALDKLATELGADGPGADEDEIRTSWSVIVECDSEQHQARLLEQFEREGLRCKPLMT